MADDHTHRMNGQVRGVTRHGKARVRVAWDGGKPTTHDAALIRQG